MKVKEGQTGGMREKCLISAIATGLFEFTGATVRENCKQNEFFSPNQDIAHTHLLTN